MVLITELGPLCLVEYGNTENEKDSLILSLGAKIEICDQECS